MASRILQLILVNAYRVVHATGILETSFGWRTYAATYRWYKWVFDDDITILRGLLQPGDVVLDIGANVGASSLKFAEWVGTSGTVFAIEPEARNFSELARVVKRSKCRDRISLVEAAVSDKPGIVSIRLNALNPGDHRIAKEGQPVTAVTIDGLIKDHGLSSLRAIKVDVQGAEPLVMAGASDTLSRLRPIIFSEIYEAGLREFGCTISNYIAVLGSYGYTPHIVEGTSLRETSAPEVVRICSRQGYLDAVFLPTDEMRPQ